jgi:hypothetical protein
MAYCGAKAVMQDSKRLDDLSRSPVQESSSNVVLLSRGRTRLTGTSIVTVVGLIEMSQLAEIRLSAGTEAMPARDERYERAVGQKRQSR